MNRAKHTWKPKALRPKDNVKFQDLSPKIRDEQAEAKD